MNKVLLLLFSFCLLNTVIYANNKGIINSKGEATSQQQADRILTGKVTDETGMSLPGASVFISGTSVGATTDINGIFQVSVPTETKKMTVSFIGMDDKEFLLGKETNYNIVMKSSFIGLDEIVVTALGITKEKKKVGYSTQKIAPEKLNEISVPNVASLFSGQVAGLTVNNPTGLFQAPEFYLRGKKPLIVIDNIPVSTNFYDVSPDNIESVNVLKGTTASALYGSRGRNGAILITTKNAKKEGLSVEIAHNSMVSAGFTVFPETQTEYGNGSNGKYEFWDGKDGGVSDGDMIWGPKFKDGVKVPQWNSPIYDNVTKETIPWWGDVSGTKYDDKSRYSRVPTPWKYHNNLKDFLETGYIASTNFSVGYKGEKGSYLLTGDYIYQKDRVPNSSLQRGGLSFKSNTELIKNLTLDTKLSYNKVYSPNYPRHGYGPKNHMYTILIWMGDDVDGNDLKNHMYIPGQEGYRQANFNYAWYNNVYFAANELEQTHNTNVINGQVGLSYDISKELNVKAKVSLVNKHTFEDRKSPKSYLNYGDPRDGDYKTWNKSNLALDYDILATYSKEINEDIKVTTNIGAASYYTKYNQEYNATDGLVVPFVYSLNNSKGGIKGNTYVEKLARNSVYGTLEIDLYNAFFLTVTARNDWSSALPKENRSYFYPSISFSSIISNLIEMPDFINFLKIYGSWATVSNDLNPYQIESYYKKSGSFGNLPKLYYPSTIVNKNIKPEKSTSYELGFSSSLLQRRLNIDFTYYNVVDSNQIIDLPISKASGFNNRKVNANEYTTNGFEVVLGAKPIVGTNFTWHTGINWSTKIQKITKIYGNKTKSNYLSLNERTDNFYGTVWQKSPDGKVILGNNGLPIKDSYKQLLGHLDPKWRIGFQNSFKYKNFTLNIGIDGVWGGVFWSKTVQKMWWGGKHPNSVEYRDAEYAAGKPVYVPDGVNVVSGELKRDINGNVISDNRVFKKNTTAVNWQTWSQNYPYRAYVTHKESEKFANVLDRTFFKLRTISLKYDLSKYVKNTKLSYLDVSLTGYNLLTWKKADIVDPDFGNDNNLQDPSSRYIGISFKAKF